MDIKPLGSLPSRRPPADYFTGTVWQDPIMKAPAPARIRGAFVRFEPRARTAWHTHPLGQTLRVMSGVGRVALWGGPVREIRPGDTVWIAPGEKHWHGAGPDTAMVHIALQEALDGTHVTWLEKVSDEQYDAKVGG
jgi:quercetin dioxygenase-like cupin family protein